FIAYSMLQVQRVNQVARSRHPNTWMSRVVRDPAPSAPGPHLSLSAKRANGYSDGFPVLFFASLRLVSAAAAALDRGVGAADAGRSLPAVAIRGITEELGRRAGRHLSDLLRCVAVRRESSGRFRLA